MDHRFRFCACIRVIHLLVHLHPIDAQPRGLFHLENISVLFSGFAFSRTALQLFEQPAAYRINVFVLDHCSSPFMNILNQRTSVY